MTYPNVIIKYFDATTINFRSNWILIVQVKLISFTYYVFKEKSHVQVCC